MTFDEYKTDMMASDPCITHMFDKHDGNCLIVKRLLFHWTLLLSYIGNMEAADDRWCYDTQERALNAVVSWSAAGYTGEPEGWHRHHKTGRRRPNGDPSKEYIAH